MNLEHLPVDDEGMVLVLCHYPACNGGTRTVARRLAVSQAAMIIQHMVDDGVPVTVVYPYAPVPLCQHPHRRRYGWMARSGAVCLCCLDCGASLLERAEA